MNESESSTTGDWRRQRQKGMQLSLADDCPVRPEDFIKNLKEAGVRNGVGGYYFSSAIGDPHHHTYTWTDIAYVAGLKSSKPEHKPFEQRTGRRYQFLTEWSDGDIARLLPKQKENPPPPMPPPQPAKEEKNKATLSLDKPAASAVEQERRNFADSILDALNRANKFPDEEEKGRKSP